MEIKLSIIIPAYNVEKYIRKTLESIIRQTLREIEVVVVNDGSGDRTSEIAKEVLSKCDVDWLVIDQKNQGESVARNVGLQRARGEYVMFLDGDDYIEEKFAEIMYEKARKYDSQIVFCKYNRVDESGNTIKSYDDSFPKIKEIEDKELFTGEFIFKKMTEHKLFVSMGSAIYHRLFLINNKLDFFPGCRLGPDTEFNLKAFYKAEKVVFVPQVLMYYVQRSGAVTKTWNQEYIYDLYQVSIRMREFFVKYNDLRSSNSVDSLLATFAIMNIFFNAKLPAFALSPFLKSRELDRFLRKGAKRGFKYLMTYLVITYFPKRVLHISALLYYKLKNFVLKYSTIKY